MHHVTVCKNIRTTLALIKLNVKRVQRARPIGQAVRFTDVSDLT